MAHGSAVRPNSWAKRRKRGLDTLLLEVASQQHWLITTAELLGLGMCRRSIANRVDRGTLHPKHRGVFAVGHPQLTREGIWMAGVLAGGPGAALSHPSAGAAWRMTADSSAAVHVTTPRPKRSRAGLVFHSSPLPPDEITEIGGIPVTTVPRTLLDLATVLTPRRLERALNEADALRLTDHLTLDDLLTRYPGRAGSKNVRAALHGRRQGATMTKSELEEQFLELLDAEGLPRPEVNAVLALRGTSPEVDCLWRAQGLVVELDSRTFHLTPTAFEQDRERDRALNAAGWRVIRVTSRHLSSGREALIADLRTLLAALRFAA